MAFFTDTVWAIPAFSALAFVTIAAIGLRTPEKGGWIAVLLVGLAGLFGVGVFFEHLGHGAPVFSTEATVWEFEWWRVGDFVLNAGTYVDNLTAFMLFVVGILVTLILVYSIGYMHEEGDARRRYYFEMTLFITGMLGLVVASNFLVLFLFWEIMGLCSYLLIGYWFTKPSAAAAAKKAFLTTRVGDAFFLVGLGILFVEFGTLDFDALFGAARDGAAGVDRTALLVANVFIFLGAVGKSAQFPLHVWLPDAMEGPTTVSALIHAATMVKAGVYLVARMLPLFLLTPELLYVVAIIGAFTALFAASMALVNNDLKRVLAYSTLSQLGYMFAALGLAGAAFHGGHTELAIAAFAVGIFHLFSHAFFKAGLFLSAGSVGHATHTYDMREMGGLAKHMPVTHAVMLLGTMSIAGVPLFSGFYSKDEILATALESTAASSFYWVVYGLLVVTAALTAYYMFRLYFMTFRGDYRGHHEDHLHESPASMTIPLVILGAFAVLGGIAMFFVLGAHGPAGWFAPMLGVGDPAEFHGPLSHGGVSGIVFPFTQPATYVVLALAAAAIFLAWSWWKPGAAPRNLKADSEYRGIGLAMYRRWYFDDAYNWLAGKVTVGFAFVLNWFDANVIDGIVNGLAGFQGWWGDRLRKWQTGHVQDYALTLIAGFLAIVVLVIYAPFVLDAIQEILNAAPEPIRGLASSTGGGA